jgi:hypothetical protein
MKNSVNVNFNVNDSNKQLMENVQKTIIQQPDYKGMGGHGPQNHGGHGLHTQKSIGIGNTTANFRTNI